MSQKISLRESYNTLQDNIIRSCKTANRYSHEITVVAATKTQSVETLSEGYECGLRNFGENYVQEMVGKYTALNSLPVQWHCIGHLQRNKIKYIAPFVSMIHTVDSEQTAREIGKLACRHNRVIDILFQVNTSGEATKSGCQPEQTLDLVRSCRDIPGIALRGLMTLPTTAEKEDDIRREFRLLRSLCKHISDDLSLPSFNELSMGMSDDYMIAIEEGATYIRPGSCLFGER